MYGGLDRAIYEALGDAVVGPIRAHTNLRWLGFYLAHSFGGSGSSWTSRRPRSPQVSTWRFLHSEGYGLAPLFVGRQFVGVDAGGQPVPPDVTPHHRIPHNDWAEANGEVDGRHAVDLANKHDAGNLVDIERGATIYLDLEADGFMSNAAAKSYLKGWFDSVAAAGYRPGVYCSDAVQATDASFVTDGKLIRSVFPNVAIWFFRIPDVQPIVFDETAARLTLPPAAIYQDADGTQPWFGRIACQFACYNQSRAVHGANLKTGASSVHRVEPIDFDASRVTDPSHPEDNRALAFSAFLPGQPAAFSLHSQGAAWQYLDTPQWGEWGQGGFAIPDNTPMADLGYGRFYDTASVAATSRRWGLVDLFGVGIDGSVWTTWRTADGPDHPGEWAAAPQLLNPSMPARFGSKMAAASRKLDVIDVFFINRNHELTATWWSPNDTDWQAHVGPITHGLGFAPATNIAAVTAAHDPERLDLFAVDQSNQVRWVQWRNPGPWQTATVSVTADVDPALGVHGIWHDGQIHIVVGGRDGSLAHFIHRDGEITSADGWIVAGFLPALSLARPMGARIVSAGGVLGVVGVSSTQTLFWSAWNGMSWTSPGRDDAVPAYSSSGRIAVFPFGGDSVDIMVPNQDGEVVLRRLTLSGNPIAPFMLAASWTMLL